MNKENILEVKDLHVDIHMTEGLLTAVRGVNFEMKRGETLGLVGESGCGKSLTCKAILGINDRKCVPSGQILFDSEGLGKVDLLSLDQKGKEIRSIRGKEISMIFQEPMVAFSPMYTIGNQINEATKLHITKDKQKSKEISMDVMRKVGIANVEKRYNQYPHEFSGGMLQRALIAMALVCNPKMLIADEPTTALDVTIQAQILELINEIKEKRHLSVIFITHNLGVVANMADRIAVMYAGKIVEYGKSEEIFYEPAHPYTWALLSSMPDLETSERLESIPGTPPNMIYPPKGDAFAPRNVYALDIDFELEPPLFEITPTHSAATWLLHPNAPKVEMPKVIKARIERMRKERG